MKSMIWLKLKLTAGVGVATLLGYSMATMAVSQTASGDKLTAEEIAAKAREAYAALSSYSDTGKVVAEIAGQMNTISFNNRLQRPSLYRIEWTQGTGPRGVVWSDGSGDYFLATASGQGKAATPEKGQNMKKAVSKATGPSWSAASTTAGVFFNQELGDLFGAPAVSGHYPLQKETDSKIGDIDCYVVSCVIDLSKEPDKGKSGTASTTLWIGKKDFLIHQCRTKYVEKVGSSTTASDQEVDDAVKKSLEMQKKPATPEAIAAMRPQMKAMMKQVQTALKSGFEKGVVFTQTHEHIVVNEKISPANFTR
jgi:outer membrane lipoprotein-sorting protein